MSTTATSRWRSFPTTRTRTALVHLPRNRPRRRIGLSLRRAAYRERVERIGALKKPVISFSHYSFAGGNRAAPLLDRFLPLPDNFQMHFYGHAHIGDAYWAGKDCYRKICGVDNQPIMQVNVASLENYRGTAIRSAIVEWYKGGEIGALFRNHSQRYWDDYLVVRSGDCRRAPERG